MDYTNHLQKISILGAAGKMGSGIVVLLVIEMGKLKLTAKQKHQEYVLNAIDISDIALQNLLKYVRAQLQKHAERKIVELRAWYKDELDLIENEEIIRQYVTDVMEIIKTSTRIETAYNSNVIFEAIKEDKAIKAKLFSQIRKNNPNALFLTNTSSIPIGMLDREAGLNGRLIGFHFYNPPVVQKLLEIIKSEYTLPELTEFAEKLARSMRKTIVYSFDKAGFIGNGHFMRDALYAMQKADEISKKTDWGRAIYMVDTITRDCLLRPMGIFQLIDYVGIDVTHFILQHMQPSFPDEKLHHPFLDTLLAQGVNGGQYADGSQKNGFFKYEKGRIVAVYNVHNQQYQEIEQVKTDCLEQMGKLPAKNISWKSVIRDTNKKDVLARFFKELQEMDSLAARLAIDYGNNSKAIAQMLVDTRVAASEKDVNTVLETGFYHAYGPINEYFN